MTTTRRLALLCACAAVAVAAALAADPDPPLSAAEHAEWAALAALHRATGGPRWVGGDDWAVAAPARVCERGVPSGPGLWSGLYCQGGAVVSVALTSFGLDGTVPVRELAAGLPRLASLTLGNNPRLGGTLPVDLPALPALRALALDSCGFGGTLPASWARLDLYAVDVTNNHAVRGTLPPEWGALDNLTSIQLGGTRLGGTLPAEWAGMAGLGVLSMPACGLSGALPPAWGPGLRALTRLNLAYNRVSGTLPARLGSSAISWIDVSENHMEGTLPASWGAQPLMERLFLGGNRLSGTVPASWGNWTHLWHFDLHFNRVSGTLPAFAAARQLKRVNVDGNLMSGTVPGALLAGPDMAELHLRDNAFEALGPLPSADAEFMPKGELFFVSGNRLSGRLPPQLCGGGGGGGGAAASTHLDRVDLYNNSFEGAIPACLGHGLLSLDASFNRFSAVEPGLLGANSTLQHLRLRRNAFDGKLLGALTGGAPGGPAPLKLLDVADNPVGGNVQDVLDALLGAFPFLDKLRLANTSVHGAIGGTVGVSDLNLDDNALFRGFPEPTTTKYYQLNSVESLSVSNTGYSTAPALYGTLRSLVRSATAFDDCVPAALLRSWRVERIDVRGSEPTTDALCLAGMRDELVPAEGQRRFFLDRNGLTCPQWLTRNARAFVDAGAPFLEYDGCRCLDGLYWDAANETCAECPGRLLGRARCDPYVQRPLPCLTGSTYPALPGGRLAGAPLDVRRVKTLQCRRPGLCNTRGDRCARRLFSRDGLSRQEVARALDEAAARQAFECADGHDPEALLCSRCKAGHWRSGDSCLPCRASFKWLVPLVLAAALAGVLVYLCRKAAKPPGEDRGRTLSVLFFWLQVTHLLEESAQVHGGHGSSTSWRWVASARATLEAWAVFRPLAAQCLAGDGSRPLDFVAQSYVSLASPLAVAALAGLARAVVHARAGRTATFVGAYLLRALYLPVLTAALRTLPCEEQQGVSYVQAAPYVPCDDSRLAGLRAFAVCVVAVFVLPAAALVARAAWRERARTRGRSGAGAGKSARHDLAEPLLDSLEIAEADEAGAAGGRQQEPQRDVASQLLFGSVRADAELWWWPLGFDLARDTSLAMLVALVPPRSPLLPVGIFLVLALAALAYARFWPAARAVDRALELAMLLAANCLYLLAILGRTQDAFSNGEEVPGGTPGVVRTIVSVTHVAVLAAVAVCFAAGDRLERRWGGGDGGGGGDGAAAFTLENDRGLDE